MTAAAFLIQFRPDGSDGFQTEYAKYTGDDVIVILDVQLEVGALLKLRLPNRKTGELSETTGRVVSKGAAGTSVRFEEMSESVSAMMKNASSSELPTEDLLYAGGSSEDLIATLSGTDD